MEQPETTLLPITLVRRRKKFTTDGGHRSFSPEDILRRYTYLIGRSGIIEELQSAHSDPCNLVHVCVAHLRFALEDSRRGLWKGLRAPCVGKGVTGAQARASALGEAVERYSGIFRGDEV